MGLNQQAVRLSMVLAALSLGVAGCQSAPSANPAFVPSSAGSALNLGSPVGLVKHTPVIKSSCGDRVHIVLLGIVDCKFKEKDYNGEFKVSVQTKGLISISPSKGNQDTKFTVTGLILGKGYFLVRAQKGVSLKVKVRVTL